MIGAYNIDEIKTDVENIIGYSQEYPFPVKVDRLIEDWAKAKKRFIDAFGGTIYRTEQKVNITLSEEEKRTRVERFIKELRQQELMTNELEEFLKDNYCGIFHNKVVMPCSEKEIKVGMKLSKSLGKFFEDYDDLRRVQDKISTIMQESSMSGYLYLSVDPRDFLTISDNASGWRSCHALDGAYRSGNLSYMVDEVTVIAYLADDTLKHYNALPLDMKWTNKRWRKLLHINEDTIYYNREYPFECKMLRDKARELIATKIGYSNLVPRVYDHTVALAAIDSSEFNGYCDLNSNDYFAVYTSKSYPSQIRIGKLATCVRCGKHPIWNSRRFLCSDCLREVGIDDFYLYCPYCGRRLYPNMNQVYFEDEPFCSNRCIKRYKEDMNIKDGGNKK